ncbi:MAG: hypothetical protein JJU08_14450 [Rhodobacteraceae bacterium]|nr:hypothetical protein [Paracoccaceae bacterium]
MRLKGYRTLIFNIAAALPVMVLELLPVIMPVLSLPELRAVLPEGWLPWWVLLTALGNMAMRRVTDTPFGRDRS